MKFSTAAASLALTGTALAGFHNGTESTFVYTKTVDTVVTKFTTFCPAATELTINDKTITVTGATTLTITDCPCTIPTTKVVTTTGLPPSEATTVKTITCTEEKCVPKVEPTTLTSTYKTVVTKYTTYCPAATTLTHGSVTIPVTAPGTITVTKCPEEGCTVEKTSLVPTSVPVVSTHVTSTYKTVVTKYTTYCPVATTLTHGSVTIPVTAPGTVTVTKCPEEGCTVKTSSVLTEVPIETPVVVQESSTTVTYSPPVVATTAASTPVESAPVSVTSAPVTSAPVESTSVPVSSAPAASNGTSPSVPVATGAAAQVVAPALGLLAAAAFFL